MIEQAMTAAGAIAPDTPVYVPAHPRYPADPQVAPQIGFELLQSSLGGPVPVAFTSTEKLVAALGEAQPWIAVPARSFVQLMRGAGYAPVYLDPELPPGTRTWSPQDLDQYATAAGVVAR
ncbi:SseB family protein [Kitasatospora sp. RB6PN24]|uniref:SAV_915 family protein n=1 Tax=Kitasatospora humi TaxID=2893891 RepID=UPI001E323E5B|nr:SAV_915 family protein [Kitasatospora humi]MCC9309011.1 SseB family protein [Kitasatospora humi]